MKIIIILGILIAFNIHADIYKKEEAYIIDKIKINKLPKCSKIKILTYKTQIIVFNKKYTKKKTTLKACKTKQNKIKLIITKITEKKEMNK